MKMQKSILLKTYGLILLMCVAHFGYTQRGGGGSSSVTFTGPTSAIVNDNDYYNVSISGGTYQGTTYVVSGGIIISQSNSQVQVKWTSAGSSKWVRADVQAGAGPEHFHQKYVYVNVTPAMPSAPAVSSNTCGNKTVTRSSPPSGETWYWQTSSGGTSTSNSASTYTMTSSGTVYLRARSSSGGYWSSARSTSVTVNAYPSQPSAPSVSTNTCGNKTLTRGTPPGGVTWYWQGTNSSGTSTSNSSSTYTVSSSGTYYIRARTSAGCWSSARSISVTVNPYPSTPSTPSVSSNVCGNKTLTRGTPPSGVTWYWQGTNSSGTSTSNSSSTYTASSSGTYYIRARTSAGCWSSSRSVGVTVYANLGAGSIGNAQTLCYNGNPSTLTNTGSATGSNGSYSYQWQHRSPGGSWSNISGATSTTYNPPALTATKEYRRRVQSCSQTKYTNTIIVTIYGNLGAGSIGNAQTLCYNGNPSTLTNTASASAGNGSYSYQWQHRSPGGSWSNISGASSTTYNPPALTSTKEYRRRVISCGQTKYTSTITVTIYGNLNAGSIGNAQTLCYNGNPSSLTSTASASAGNGSYNYQWQSRSPGGSWANISGATSTTYNPPALTSTKEYRRRVISCGQTKYTNTITVTINPLPDLASGSNNSRCGNGTVTLTASPGSNGNTIRWYSASSGGTLLHTGTSYTTPLLSSNTIYYAASYNSSTGCLDTDRKAITAVINPIPALASGSNSGRCGTGTVNLTASPGSNGNTIRWYSSSSGGTLLHTGTSYTTPSISSNTTYYAASYNSSTGCLDTDRKAITAVIDPIPALASGSNNSRCGTGTVTLTASPGTNGTTIRWYSAATGGTLLHTGTSYTTPSISSSITYHAASYNSTTQCEDSDRVAIMAVIDAIPDLASGSDNSRCATGAVTLTASPGANGTTIRWYSASTGGTLLYTGTSYTTPSISSSTTYHAASYNSTTQCEDPDRVAITAVVDAIPGLASGSDNSRCGTGTLILNASSGTNGDAVRWYDASSGGTLLYTGANYTTPSLIANTTYYAASYNTTTLCEDPDRKAITAIVNSIPAIFNVGGDISYCPEDGGATIQLSGSQSGVNYTLYRGASNVTTVPGTGGPLDFDNQPAGTYTIEAVSMAGSCTQTMSGSHVLTAFSQPATPTFANVNYGLDETVITRDVPSSGETWYWQTTSTGKDQTDPALTKSVLSTGSYYLRSKSDNGCWGDAAVMVIVAQEPVSVSISPLSNESIQISWSGVSGNETGFNISRSTSPSGAYSLIHTAASTDTDYTDTGLSTGTSYYYRVQAVVGSQVSTGTQVAAATTSPEFNGDETIVHSPAFNGNISATRWKGYNDESEQVMTYGYDGLNRLKSAHYAAQAINTYEKNNGYFSVPDINYDLNGNITSLTRQGFNPSNNPDIIDELTYSYSESSGNQLLGVTDVRSGAGFSDGTNTGDDYTYDPNGNMTQDLNKGITSIEYNYLNLPEKVVFQSGDSITYLYDAAGIKLQQIVYEGGNPVKTTDYVGGHIYEDVHDTNGPQLKLVQHEEGRLTYDDFGQKWDYEYHLKDHLGNTRLTFTTAEDDPYETTQDMETANDDGVTPALPTNFVNIPHTNAPQANTTDGGNEVARLNPGNTGVMIFIDVAKGDKVNFSVQANYDENQIGTFNLVSIAASAILGDYNAGAIAAGAEQLPVGADNVINSGVADMTSGGGTTKQSSDDAPLAYINYIYFNQDMTFNRAGFEQITTAANGLNAHEEVTLDAGEMENAGFLLAYLTNESNEAVAVNFDDFKIFHTPTKVLQSDDYYPFGLTFNGYQRTASTVNRFKYNGKELDENTNWYDYGARMYMSDIARFGAIDPLAMIFQSYTPYQYALNNPIRFEDWNGQGPGDRVKIAKSIASWGIPYSMQIGINSTFSQRTEIAITGAGLRHLDCSEFVYRVLEQDGLLENRGGFTGDLVNEFEKGEKWIKSNSPEIGDVFLWRDENVGVDGSGHTGIVTGVITDDEGNVTDVEITHAKGTGYGTVTEVKSLSYFTEHWGWKGFFRPVTEYRPDRIEKKDGETLQEWLARAENALARARANAEIKRKRKEKRQKEKERRKKEREEKNNQS